MGPKATNAKCLVFSADLTLAVALPPFSCLSKPEPEKKTKHDNGHNQLRKQLRNQLRFKDPARACAAWMFVCMSCTGAGHLD